MAAETTSLAGKRALVTGGGTGIGAACAVALAQAGCHVAITGRREAPLKLLAEKTRARHPLSWQTSDVGNRESVARLFAWAASDFGPIDILVNSAGVNIARRSLLELSIDDWQQVMDINATGVFLCMKSVLPQMLERRDGLIVNISSIAGLRAALLGGIAYNASKFAATALGITAALELKDSGVRVTNIYPGEVETPILDARPVPVSAEHRARILQPEDVAAALLMVASLPPRANVSELTIKPTTQAFC